MGFHTGRKGLFFASFFKFLLEINCPKKFSHFFYFHFWSHCDIAPSALKKGKEEKDPLPMLPILSADLMRWEIVASCGVAARCGVVFLQYYFSTSILIE